MKIIMKKTNQKGFSAVEGVLLLVILGMIGFTGWYVYHSKKVANKESNSQATVQTVVTKESTSTNPYAGWKTYTNQEAGLTFQYPSNWTSQTATITPDSGGSFLGISGTLTSPTGNPLYWIYQEAGGKGDANCTPNASDAPFSSTNNCATKQTYSVVQIPSAKATTSSVGRNLFEDRLYITETKYAWPGTEGLNTDPVSSRQSTQPIYQICLDPYYNSQIINGQDVYPQPQVGTVMGFELPCNWWDTGFNATFPVANQGGFSSTDAKTAVLIMKTFNSL